MLMNTVPWRQRGASSLNAHLLSFGQKIGAILNRYRRHQGDDYRVYGHSYEIDVISRAFYLNLLVISVSKP